MSFFTNLLNRKVINYPKLQYGVTGFFVFLGVINLLFFGILLRVLHSRVLIEIGQLNEDYKPYILAIFNDISATVFQSMVFFGSFILLISFFGGVVLLQHITGPSFAFKIFLKAIMNGEQPRYPMKLRKYDFFSEHAELLNELYKNYEIKKRKEDK